MTEKDTEKTWPKSNRLNRKNLNFLLEELARSWHIDWVSDSLPKKNGFSRVVDDLESIFKGNYEPAGCMPINEFVEKRSKKKQVKPNGETESAWQDLAFVPVRNGDQISFFLINGKSINQVEVEGKKVGHTVWTYELFRSSIKAMDNLSEIRLDFNGDRDYGSFGNETKVLPLELYHHPSIGQKALGLIGQALSLANSYYLKLSRKK